MRREERHHLKENPLAVMLTDAQRVVSERGRGIAVGAGLVVVALLAAGGYLLWQQWQTERAGALLAEAMTVMDAQVVPPPEDAVDAIDPDGGPDAPETPLPESVPFAQPPGTYASVEAKLEAALPRLLAVAEAYPQTPQGISARYQAAAALVALGRAEEAGPHYEQIIDAGRNQIYGEVAVLGLAEAHLVSGRHEEAIALLESQTSTLESSIPGDAVLMRLGQAYALAGRPADAQAAFTRVVEEFPLSVYYIDAQRELDALRVGDGEAAPGA